MAVTVQSGSSEDDDYDNDSSSSYTVNIETIRMQVSAMAARLSSRVSLETLRPLSLFLGISTTNDTTTNAAITTGAFTLPVQTIDKHSVEKCQSRVRLNVFFFLSNYVLVAAMVGLVVALLHPGMLVLLTGVYALWSLHSFLIRHELVVAGINVGTLLTIQQRFYLLFCITTIVVILKCLRPALLFAIISSLLILTHAFFRSPKHIQSSGSSDGEEEQRQPMMIRGSNSGDSNDDAFGGYDEEGGGSGGDSSGSEVLVGRPSNH